MTWETAAPPAPAAPPAAAPIQGQSGTSHFRKK